MKRFRVSAGAAPALAAVLAFYSASFSLRAATVTTMTGENYQGNVALDSGLVVTPSLGAATKVDFANILDARFTAETDGGNSVQPGIVLKNGNRLPGATGAITDPALKVAKYALSVPSQEVAWVVYRSFPETITEKLNLSGTGALLAGGDFFEGAVKAADASSVKVISPLFGPRTFATQQKDLLAAVLRDIKPAPSAYEVLTTDGFLFYADALGADRASLSLKSSIFGLVKIDAKDVAEIRAGAGRYQVLTALKPSRIDAPAGQNGSPAFTVDKSLDGKQLAASGLYVKHGLEAGVGVVATWELPPGFNVFIAQVSLSPNLEGDPHLAFAVYADGRQIFRSPAFGALDGLKPVRATIAGARLLSLRVEPSAGATQPVGSGVWIEPMLIKR